MSYRPVTDTFILARPKVPYYGAFPNGFLERARWAIGAHIEDPVLFVCGGRVRDYPGRDCVGPHDRTLDLDPALEPDFLQDAREPFPLRQHQDGTGDPLPWAAVLIDRPYTPEDAAHYAPGADKLPSANLLLKHGLQVVRPGGCVGVLDYVIPQPPNEAVVGFETKFVAEFGVFCGFNNRKRAFTVFQRRMPRK